MMFNRQTFDTSIIKRWQDFDYKDIRVGNEFMFYNNVLLYDAPYVSTRLVFNQPNQNSFTMFAKVAALDFPNYNYLNGTQVQGSLGYNYSIMRNLSTNVEIGGDRTTAAITAYSSYGMYASLGVQIAEDSTNLQLNARATVIQRNYWDVDPIWGSVRSDSGVVYVVQNNNSNIGFYSYNKAIFGVYFKNVY